MKFLLVPVATILFWCLPGMSVTDIEITRQLRQSLMSDKSLSTNAQNIKIITQDGSMTLKGPVKSQDEISKIELYARMTPGQKNVKNELEVSRGE